MTTRRKFLALAAAVAAQTGVKAAAQARVAPGAQAPAQRKDEGFVASATRDNTPRVGIVLSSFRGGADHDGTPIAGLAQPAPAASELTAAQVDAMVVRALEVGVTARGPMTGLFAPDDWIVIKTSMPVYPGLAGGQWTRGAAADLYVVRAVAAYLARNRCGARITIAEGADRWKPAAQGGGPVDGWNSTWEGAFSGLTYAGMVAELGRQYRTVRFDCVDLNFDDPVPAPAPRRQERSYFVPKTIRSCDKLIAVAPLRTDPRLGVALSLAGYLGAAPGSKYGFPKRFEVPLEEAVADLYSFHPADYAVLGGSWGTEGGGASVHHNVIVAGGNAVAVDAAGAAIMGFDPAAIPHLRLAVRSGYGTADVDAIWTRGNTIEEARRPFRHASTKP